MHQQIGAFARFARSHAASMKSSTYGSLGENLMATGEPVPRAGPLGPQWG
jgi:hypothetical protein